MRILHGALPEKESENDNENKTQQPEREREREQMTRTSGLSVDQCGERDAYLLAGRLVRRVQTAVQSKRVDASVCEAESQRDD